MRIRWLFDPVGAGYACLMTATATVKAAGLAADNSAGWRSELERLLLGELSPEFVRQMRELVEGPLFDPREGLTDIAASDLAYERAEFVARALRLSPRALARDPRALFAVHEWLSLVDGVATTVFSIHYCLAAGSIVAHGQARPELEPILAELERMEACGVFLATELGYGNNVASLETEAVYEPETREFLLKSPRPQAYKFMPNTAAAVPKIAVVMARLVSLGKDRGVFPFIVRIRDHEGEVCEGVRIARLTEKPGYALDNGVTRFDGVRIPKAYLLTGSDSVLHDDGSFETRVASRHRRFLNAMDRVQAGRVCFTSAVVAMLRAATWIAVRYTSQRLTFAPGKRDVPVLAYRNVQRDVFGALAAAYALTFAVRSVQRQFRLRTAETEVRCFQQVATLKVVASSAVAANLVLLRERCGAVGMFSANRFLTYWSQVQGLITAEGDNQLMLLKVGRQLLEGGATAAGRPETVSDAAKLDARMILSLLSFREARLQSELRGRVSAAVRKAREPFTAWNQNVNGVMALANAHGECLVATSFEEALRGARDSSLRESLGCLYSLWGLGVLERHASFFLAEGLVTANALEDFAVERDRLCSAIASDSSALVEAFGIDNAVLRAPIADDDYVRALDPWDDVPPHSKLVSRSDPDATRHSVPL